MLGVLAYRNRRRSLASPRRTPGSGAGTQTPGASGSGDTSERENEVTEIERTYLVLWFAPSSGRSDRLSKTIETL